MKSLPYFSLPVILVLLFLAITSPSFADPITYAEVAKKVLIPKGCIECHEKGTLASRWGDFTSYESLFKKTRYNDTMIVKGKPEESPLFLSIDWAERDPGSEVGQMPIDSAEDPRPLSQNQIELIRNWILDGAPKD